MRHTLAYVSLRSIAAPLRVSGSLMTKMGFDEYADAAWVGRITVDRIRLREDGAQRGRNTIR